jgi:hypothetical protein
MAWQMPRITVDTTYRSRRAATTENDRLRVTVLVEGGHIAEIYDKGTGVNPLWTPDWPSIEPSTFDPVRHREYGTGAEARLLAGIMGHNICLDLFGGPSDEEKAAGLTVHGEAPVVPYDVTREADELVLRAMLPLAQLRFERRMALGDRGVRIREIVENVASHDRPVGWTQHVTLGPPFLERGVTEFRLSATRSQVYGATFGDDDYLQRGAVFDWPYAPRVDGGDGDLRRFTSAQKSSAYTAHLMNPLSPHAFFVAFSPRFHFAFGYVWKRADFPWVGIWEENRSRRPPPWNATAVTRGMEFGVSPFPETRRQMIERGALFNTPTFRWIPARAQIETEYWAIAEPAPAVPESLAWPDGR